MNEVKRNCMRVAEFGKPGEAFAYRKMVHVINCPMKTAAVLRSVYYDENNVQHEAEVADKSLQYIVPDRADDYLWKYVCKPGEQKDLGTPVTGVQKFLLEKEQCFLEAKSVSDDVLIWQLKWGGRSRIH